MDNDEQVELMQRRRDRDSSREVPMNEEKTIIERRIKPGDTLNRIAIQYAVHVSELKRANNLLNDQEFMALKMVKIPISRMRHALKLGIESTSEEDDTIDDKTRLLEDQEPSADEIFQKADSNIAQVRESLPDAASSGSFHFVDARPPDNGYSIYFVLIGVIFVFIILPLLLTVYEEEQSE